MKEVRCKRDGKTFFWSVDDSIEIMCRGKHLVKIPLSKIGLHRNAIDVAIELIESYDKPIENKTIKI